MHRALLLLLPWFLAFAGATAAKAERINGHNTWIAKPRDPAGMLHYQAGSGGRWGWTTNGRVFDCALVTKNEAQHTAELFCPSINYRMYLSRTQLSIVNQGGTATYPGNWDDRRFWYYRTSAGTGRFELKDGFAWVENQWSNAGQLAATYDFVETSRDDNYVYLRDASRNIEVAIGSTQVFVRTPPAAWAKFYDGTW